ncbi:MAG: LamG domain-containing protein, partial [Planctomycetota bacterium]
MGLWSVGPPLLPACSARRFSSTAATADRQPIVNKEGDGVRGVGYRVESDGIVHVQLYVQGWTAAADKTDLNSTVNLEPDRWYHVAYTYEFVADGSSITVLYIDGEENARTETTRGPLTTNTQIQEIGRYVWSAGYQRFFSGLIDDVVIFNHTLSADEIQGIMNGVGGGFPLASSPDPRDSATHEDIWVTLSWRPGDSAASHDVYIGENFDDVNDGAEDTFVGNQPGTLLIVGFPGFPYPDGLVPGTTYYWRIDEVNDGDPNSPWKGDVWSFWIPPRKTHDPNPADGSKFEKLDVELSWTAGFGAKLHTMYFGDNFDDVNSATVGIPSTPNTFTPPGTLELEKTYYWRIDEFDGIATHKGDVWSFTTIPVIPITDPTLVGWWKLDEGSGTTALDWSGHDHHGTLKGATNRVRWAGEGSLVNGDALSFDGYSDGVSHATDPGTINWVSV